MSDPLYGQCPHCGGSMTHRATDGKCPLFINTMEMTPVQLEELSKIVHTATNNTREPCPHCRGTGVKP